MSSDKAPEKILTWEEAKEALAKAKQSNFIEDLSFCTYIDHIKRALTDNCSVRMIIYLDKVVEIHEAAIKAKVSAEKDRDKLYHRLQQRGMDEVFQKIGSQEARRREMFEKVALKQLEPGHTYSSMNEYITAVIKTTNIIISESDKFARGEE